jgi:ADP-ribose pyrophosphatase
MTFDVIHSEIVYQGRAFGVRRDQVRLPNGEATHWDIIAHPGAVTLVPVDEQGRLWFVRQYRHAIGQDLLELPAGTLKPGEPPEECALRELREEIGMAASQLQKLGDFFLAPGYSSEHLHIFLATGLTPASLPGDADEFLKIEIIPAEQAYQMITAGQFQDGKTLAALALARLRLG